MHWPRFNLMWLQNASLLVVSSQGWSPHWIIHVLLSFISELSCFCCVLGWTVILKLKKNGLTRYYLKAISDNMPKVNNLLMVARFLSNSRQSIVRILVFSYISVVLMYGKIVFGYMSYYLSFWNETLVMIVA